MKSAVLLAAAAGMFAGGTPAVAARAAELHFRDPAAEVSAASRLLSAYGVITSTFRTVAHNKAVGGVPNSFHLLDRAIDVARRSGVTHLQIEAALKRAGFRLVESLDEHDHSHFAFAALSALVPTQTPPAVASAPPAKPLPRVAADEHGTLSLDLQQQPANGGSATTVAR